jgi:hypothetical protein
MRCRIPHALTVQVNTSSSWRCWWSARLLEVPRGGFGLLLDEPRLVETVVEVRVPGWRSRTLLILVRHVTREGGGWRCGGPLLLRLTDGALEALLGLVLGLANNPINAKKPMASGPQNRRLTAIAQMALSMGWWTGESVAYINSRQRNR